MDRPIVRVTWHDASFHSSGSGADILKDPAICVTVGVLLAEDADAMVVAHEIDGGGKADPDRNRQVSRIPMAVVMSVETARGWCKRG